MSKSTIGQVSPGAQADAVHSSVQRFRTTSDQIYCFKCRSKTDTLEAQEVVLKNGRPAVTGQCTVCETTKFHGPQEVTGGREKLCGAAVACNPG